ncbi:MAG: pentapeptide repeat-containing protein, partial [Nocardiopsaceae bacterium]|nr:pentapeptide repeat-containing protein [Nocardiopsaceae bacterium]
MEIGWTRSRMLCSTGLLAVVAGTLVIAASPAAAVTCPTVDFTTHHVSPPPAPGVDWSGCNLNNANLNGSNLAGANLSGANLSDAWLSDVNLT